MVKTKNNKIVKYKKRRYLNVGVVIFSATFIYLLAMVILSLTRDRITIYEVVKDSVNIEENLNYKGLVIRDEIVTYSDHTGYVNFFAYDGERVSLNSNIYTVSPDGELVSTLEEITQGSDSITESTLALIKDNIDSFSMNYTDLNFDSVYSFKFNMDYIVLENFNLSNAGENSSFTINKASNSGTLIYSIDNYESVSSEDIDLEMFNDETYIKKILKSGDSVNKGDPLYKTITSETWSIIIPLTEDETEDLKNKNRLKIKFLTDNITETADFEILELSDGNFGKLTFDKYCIRYANNRFLDIKIIKEKKEGLKIPKSAVVEKDFFVIPEEYCMTDNGKKEFLLQVTNDDGVVSANRISPEIYFYNNGLYYISKNDVAKGSLILKKDSSDIYVIDDTKVIKGVYNVNNGYADFQYIEILTMINDYYIIKEKTGYSPSQYDYIVLNGSNVTENEVVFR